MPTILATPKNFEPDPNKNQTSGKEITLKFKPKTLFIILVIILIGVSLFLSGYWLSQNKLKLAYTKQGKNAQKENAPIQISPTNQFPTMVDSMREVPYGDEDFESDPAYRRAMEMDTENDRFASYYGYSIALKPGWRKIDSFSYADNSVKREVFSPLQDQEIKNIQNEDPYNPNFYLEVEIKENPDYIPLLEWIDKNTPQSIYQKKSPTKVGNYDAFKVIANQGEGYVDYYISFQDKVYNLGYFYTTGDQWKSPQEFYPQLFEEMIFSITIAK